MKAISGQFRETGRFLWAIRWYWTAAILIFAVFTAGAWATAALNPRIAGDSLEKIVETFDAKGIYESEPDIGNAGFDGEAGAQVKINVFRLIMSNLMAMGYSMVLGFLPFVCLPALTLAMNAAIIGLMGGAMQLGGMKTWVFLASLAPHGIFELPSLFISCGLGLYLSVGLGRKIFRSRKAKSGKALLGETMRLFVLAVVPLTVLAGVTETYVTPRVMFWLLSL